MTWGLAFFRFFISDFSCLIPNDEKSVKQEVNRGVERRHLGTSIMGPERFVSLSFFWWWLMSWFWRSNLGKIIFFMKNDGWF